MKIIAQQMPLEIKQVAQRRKPVLEAAYAPLALHASKLQLSVFQVATFYQPVQYYDHARIILGQLQLILKSQERLAGKSLLPVVRRLPIQRLNSVMVVLVSKSKG